MTATNVGVAAAPLDGDASAPRPGAAQPPLDLSQGHIGTSDSRIACDVVVEGPYALELDYERLVATLTFDAGSMSNRQERREAMRPIRRLLREAARCGMRIVREVAV